MLHSGQIIDSVMQGTRNPKNKDIDYDEIAKEVDASIEQDEINKRTYRITQEIIERTGQDEFYQLPLDKAMALVRLRKPDTATVAAYEKIGDRWERDEFFRTMTKIYGNTDDEQETETDDAEAENEGE